MKIKITSDRHPFVNGRKMEHNEIVEVSAADGKVMLDANLAVEVLDTKAKTKKSAPKRARNKKGQPMADDPNTPDVNEAWEGGEAPA